MAELIRFSWLGNYPTLKEGLKKTFGCSGQLIKRYFSSRQQQRPIKVREVQKLPLNFVNHLKINPCYVGPDIKILKETKDYLVLHKPPRVYCHPLCYEDQDTLLNFLAVQKKWESLLVNETHYDRGLLYRLDYETSGVIVLIKNELSLQFMRKNFETTMRRKFYWAVVEGEFDKEGRWTHFFKSTGLKGVKQRVLDLEVEGSHKGTLSALKVTSHQGVSLVLVNLKTGLRHQIRAQLSHLGFPILGDELYGGKKADRLFLHALRYEFNDVVEDPQAELFQVFFDLNGALQMSHEVLGRF